jgi:hypothetical protein
LNHAVTLSAAFAQPPVWVAAIALGALVAWSSLLAHKAISNFHDGLRPLFPEFLAGGITRRELARTAFTLSLGFVIGFGVPLAVTSGLVMVYLLLLPADVIGTGSPRPWVAVLIGAAWGALAAAAVYGVGYAAALLPVNFATALSALYLPVEYAVVAFPALAVGFQFGPGRGIAALALIVLVRELVALLGSIGPLDPQSAGMAAGLVLLLGLAISRDRRERGAMLDDEDAEMQALFLVNVSRLRRNIPWLAVQGALISTACRLWVFGGSEVDFALVPQGKLVEAALADGMRGFAFMPLIVTSSLTTGVAGAAGGFTLVYSVGYLAPHPAVAAILGAAVVTLQILALEHINRFLFCYPSVREAAEHMRGALVKALEAALLVGGILAADKLIPGGIGILIAISLYVLNEVAGQRVFRLAAAPLAALGVGLLANVFAFAGVQP